MTEQLITRVGTSITTLVISFSLLMFSGLSFYIAIYRPREQGLQEQADEIQQLENLVNSLTEKRQRDQTRRNKIKSRINQLNRFKRRTVSWTDKLRAINRNLVNGIWLESFEVKLKTHKPKPELEEKKRKKRRKKTKSKEESEEVKKKPPSQLVVTIKGATYASFGKKPLKLIAKFMKDLMTDPVWEKNFDLTDWAITTYETTAESAEELGEDLQEDLKTVSFRLELEKKG
jgi:hypothetical protein